MEMAEEKGDSLQLMCPKTKGTDIQSSGRNILSFCQCRITIITRYLCSDQNIYSPHTKTSGTTQLLAAKSFCVPFAMEI